MTIVSLRKNLLLLFAANANPFAASRGRVLLGICTIALGVALGVAVHVINHAAVNEFSHAVAQLSGKADLVVSGPRAGFDESVYAQVARAPQAAAVSPVIEVHAKLQGFGSSLKILGLDPFRATLIEPGLVSSADTIPDLMKSDSLWLSEPAARSLGKKVGDDVAVQVGLSTVSLRVIGVLTEPSQELGVMDIAQCQWRLQRLGRLSRIDIRLKPGTDIEGFARRLSQSLPAGIRVSPPTDEARRVANLSRAYRVNLAALALVALFTGGFLIFTTQTLAVLRRRTHLALLRVLGIRRRGLAALLLCEGAVIGAFGSLLGVGLGLLIGALVLDRMGADLGGGYFPGVRPSVQGDFWTMALFFLLGTCVSVMGTVAPALEAATSSPAQSLRSGDQERALQRLGTVWPGFAFILAGILCAVAPPVYGLPLFGYASIACVLVGSVLLTPRVSQTVFAFLKVPRSPAAHLAVLGVRGAPGQMALSLAAILVSVSFVAAMAIMVSSFRQSFQEWLHQILPADLYVRAASTGDSAYLSEITQAEIRSMPGIRKVDFVRSQQIVLDPARAPVTLIARTVDSALLAEHLPLIGPRHVPALGEPPAIWVSEVARDLYGFAPGQRVRLPIEGRNATFTVAGIWRDYARENGALLIDRTVYLELTDDHGANDAGVYLARGQQPPRVARLLREAIPGGDKLEIAEPSGIRALSLKIFDRTFYVTYGLEVVALVIGLLGISTSFSAQVLARRGEFGMLRHIGVTRRQVAMMLGIQGGLASGLGVASGLALGWVISLILIFVVNRQSFHWSMDLHFPALTLAVTALLIIVASTLTAAWTARQATSGGTVRAVHEDW